MQAQTADPTLASGKFPKIIKDIHIFSINKLIYKDNKIKYFSAKR